MMLCYSKQLKLEGYYIYGYLREENDAHGKAGTLYYIGKGGGNRAICQHLVPVPTDYKNIIIIEHTLTEEKAHIGEIDLVAKYGRIDLGTGILLNRTKGGQGFAQQNKNTVLVKNSNGEKMRVAKDDPRLVTGELVGINKGKTLVRDKEGNTFMTDINDPRRFTGELTHPAAVKRETRRVKDVNGNRFIVSKDDPRIKTGELVGYSNGVKLGPRKQKVAQVAG